MAFIRVHPSRTAGSVVKKSAQSQIENPKMLLSQLSTEQIEERLMFGLLARQDLLVYAQLNSPEPGELLNPNLSRYQWKQHHRLIADALMRLESGDLRNLEIEMPPRYSKTELGVRNFVTWHAGRHPERDLLVITATYELAAEHGRDCRDYFNGLGYQLTFGDNPAAQLRRDSQSADRLQLVGGGKIQFFGRGGIPAGVGGHGLVFDDFFKSAEEAFSESERSKAWRCYVADCLSRMNSARSWKLVIGSRKNEDDVQGRLFDPTNPHYDEAVAQSFTRIRIPALSEGGGDPLGRPKDEVCWPERFPQEFYLAKRNHQSDIVRADFWTQDQCNPSPAEGTWFKKSWLKTYLRSELPKNLRIYVASDHAYRIQEKNDFSCLLVAGIDPAGTIYILPDTIWARCETDELTDHIFRLIETKRPAQWWAARDAISGSILPLLKRRMLDTHRFFWIDDSISENTDLVARSAAIRGYMAMGLVRWPSEWPQWAEAEKQLLSFPGKRDDLVAALAMLGMGLDRMTPAEGAKSNDLPKPGTLAWHSWGRKTEKVKDWPA